MDTYSAPSGSPRPPPGPGPDGGRAPAAASPELVHASRHRRNDFDVTNTVQVSSTPAVRHAVEQLVAAEWPGHSFAPIAQAFDTFHRLFTGTLPGYLGVDTLYHDCQHTLDMTLAAARLLVGYERSHDPAAKLGFERAAMGIVTALFHDAGYIRTTTDTLRNGAEYTPTHVTRSARFLAGFLPTAGMADWVPIATRVVHYTGYELPFAQIRIADWRDRKVGHLLGTADLIAQMSDRCYLEKCRDRLYPEFVLAGVALGREHDGGVKVRYSSGLDLLRQTPRFIEYTLRERLDGEFGGAYRHVEKLYDGQNPYMHALFRNFAYLQQVLRTGNWQMLRRKPPCFVHVGDAEAAVPNVRSLMLSHIKGHWGRA